MAQEGVLRTVASNAAINFLLNNPRLVMLVVAVVVVVGTQAGDVAMGVDPAAAPEMGDLSTDSVSTYQEDPTGS